MTGRSAIHLDPAEKIALKCLDLAATAAAAVPLEVLPALDACHLLNSQFSEHLSRDVFHRGGTTACISGEILFFQYFSGGITIRAVLVKAVTDLCMEESVGCDLDDVSAVAAAQPDDLAVKSLRRLFDRN